MAISDAIMDIDLGSSNSSEKEKKQPKVWLNPLYPTDIEVRNKLKEAIELLKNSSAEPVSLAYGLGIDTMPDLKLSGSAEWQKTVLRRTKLRENLTDVGMSLKPGETCFVPMLVQIRRVNEKVEVVDDDESFDLTA